MTTADSLIFNKPAAPGTTPTSKLPNFQPKNLSSNFVFIILGFIILVEIILGVRSFISPSRQTKTIFPISQSKIILDTGKQNFTTTETIPLKIRIITGGKYSDSTDLILQFDPSLLSVSASSITRGKIYTDYPVSDVDNTKGLIRISGISSPGKEGFNGIGEFATINFKAKKEGKSEIKVQFSPGSTTDSNIVESGVSHDMLSEVKNVTLNIGNASAQTSSSPNNKCSGYTQYCRNNEGKVGTQNCTSGTTINKICSFDALYTTSCDSCKINQ